MTQQLCPEPTVLAAFGRGDLPKDICEQIAAHVPDCPSCQHMLAQLGEGSDALLSGLRHIQGKDAATPLPDTQPTQHPSPSQASALRTPPEYELLGEVGRGGMGMVFRARDIRLNREVAIKLLRDDCRAEPSVYARFVAEAQITGQLQHPGIPAVHELGQLPDGRPFLAMKLVKGRTLGALLHERADPGQERGRFLAIFEQICHAVGYAHAHRVIHRDLKPGNIMVGAFGEVQVMDWGLAKLLTAPAAPSAEDEGVLPETLLTLTNIEPPQGADSATRTGSVMGTPAYMAPEQAVGEVRKLDARSDVFGLGAILCAILTGSPPYRGKDSFAVRLQAVRGELADALSRLDGCGAEPEVVALCKRCLAFKQEDRPADGGAVAAAVASIRQAAEERARRAELERAEALVREAEQRKRRRVWLGLAACLLLGLLASTALGFWANHARQQAEMARAAEAEARQAEKERAEGERLAKLEAVAAKEQTQKRLKQIEKGNEILTSIFIDLDIEEIKKGTEPLEAVLAQRLVKAAEQLEGEAVGDSLMSLGSAPIAIKLFEKAHNTMLAERGKEHPDTLDALNDLAGSYYLTQQWTKALPLLETTLRLRETVLGVNHPDTLTSMTNLASCYGEIRQLEKALPLMQESLRLHQTKLGTDHRETLTTMNGLAAIYYRAGQVERALSLLEENLRLVKSKLGVDHPHTLISMDNLAACYREAGQLDKALPLVEETLRLGKAKLGAEHPQTLTYMNNLADTYNRSRQWAKALPLLQEALRLSKAKRGPDHPYTLSSMNNLAMCYQALGQLADAIPLFEEMVRLQKAKLGADDPETLTSMANLSIAYCEAKYGDKAVPLVAEYFQHQRQRLKPDDPVLASQLANAALKLMACDHYKEAEPYIRECLAIREKQQPDAWATFNTQSMLGGALLGQRKYAEAESLLLKGYEGMKQQEAKIPKASKGNLTEAVLWLVQLYDAWGKPMEAAKWRKVIDQYQTTQNKPKH
jgi:eukaryotic-like serine/threonine-protein kinase